MKYRHHFIIGVDEVGRGCIAGDVAVGAVLIPANFDKKFFRGIRDSKKLSESQREEWFRKMNNNKKIQYTVCYEKAAQIDKNGLTKSIEKAIKKALKQLAAQPRKCLVLLDGTLKAPDEYARQKTIIKGDEKIPAISLASIVAKVFRDRQMTRYAKRYPKYGFEKHKGYGTKAHLRAIQKHGVCEIHRRSFLKKLFSAVR
jgi:ribonuclease HII